MLYYWLQI